MSEAFLCKLEAFAKKENLPWTSEENPAEEEDTMLENLRNGIHVSTEGP